MVVRTAQSATIQNAAAKQKALDDAGALIFVSCSDYRRGALLRPSVTVSRRLAGTIEEACNLPIRHQPRQLAHERYRILRRWPMVAADSIQSQLDL
jgi:hypothetical protein